MIAKEGSADERAVTKAVFQQLKKGRTDKRPTRKGANKIPHEVMKQDLLKSVV